MYTYGLLELLKFKTVLISPVMKLENFTVNNYAIEWLITGPTPEELYKVMVQQSPWCLFLFRLQVKDTK